VTATGPLWVDSGMSEPELDFQLGNLLCWLDPPDWAKKDFLKFEKMKKLIVISLVFVSFVAFAVGVNGGWAIAQTYFGMKELHKISP